LICGIEIWRSAVHHTWSSRSDRQWERSLIKLQLELSVQILTSLSCTVFPFNIYPTASTLAMFVQTHSKPNNSLPCTKTTALIGSFNNRIFLYMHRPWTPQYTRSYRLNVKALFIKPQLEHSMPTLRFFGRALLDRQTDDSLHHA